MLLVQPQRGGGRGGGQIDGDTGLAKLVDDAVEPAEFPAVLFRLDAVPAEDGEGDGVDAGLLHEPDVVVPHVFRPLVGVVVSSECDASP